MITRKDYALISAGLRRAADTADIYAARSEVNPDAALAGLGMLLMELGKLCQSSVADIALMLTASGAEAQERASEVKVPTAHEVGEPVPETYPGN